MTAGHGHGEGRGGKEGAEKRSFALPPRGCTQGGADVMKALQGKAVPMPAGGGQVVAMPRAPQAMERV